MQKAFSDESLIKITLDGDYNAFESLVKRYESRIFSHIYNMIGDSEETEDIIQEIFLKTYRSLNSFRGESSFSTWLYKIATNTCIERLRKDKNMDTVSIDKSNNGMDAIILQLDQNERDYMQGNPVINILKKEIQGLLNKVISSLPKDKKIVFILKEVDGLSNEDISNILGISIAAVKSRLYRARALLRNRLSKYFI